MKGVPPYSGGYDIMNFALDKGYRMNHWPNCEVWTPELKSDALSDAQLTCLNAFRNAGFVPFIHRHDVFIGAGNENRTVVIVHRGSGRRWEVVFNKALNEVAACHTVSLSACKDAGIIWLSGRTIEDVVAALSPFLRTSR